MDQWFDCRHRSCRRTAGMFAACSVFVLFAGGWGVPGHAEPADGLSAGRLRCEYLENPLGIDVREPRLTWRVESNQRGQKQQAYQILVASSKAGLASDTGDLWDTGKQVGDATVLIPHAGKPLASRMTCHWKVRVWDKDDRPSPWSDPASWSMGLLETSDWEALWLGEPAESFPKDSEAPSPFLRTTFNIEDKPVRAIAYVATMGYSELHVNGRRIGEDVCGPPVSDYNKRAYYVTYDVTDSVRTGTNAIGVRLGRGWYCASFPGVTHPGPIARVQLEVTLADGKTVQVASNESWKMHPGPDTALGDVRKGNLTGERYDATRETANWDEPRFDASTWTSPVAVPPPAVTLSSVMMEPNRITETIPAVSLKEIEPGEFLFDFGRNLTGMVEFHLRGTPDAPVRMSFIERWDEEDRKWIDYRQHDEYVPRTKKEEVYRNTFNYHAFRYVRVAGLARPPKLGDIEAKFVRTDFAPAGSFECSNDLLNRIYRITRYTFECVTAGGVSVDCPHRERLGYGGDGQITSKSALYAYDLGALYTKWLGNWRDVQDPETGFLPNIAPAPHGAGGGPTWGAICVLLPWDLYLHYGDRRVLQDNYDMMKKYLAFLESKLENGQLKPYGDPKYGFLGDWVAPDHDQGNGPWSPEEWRTFFNNCFYAYVAEHVGKIAAALGEQQDAARFDAQAAELRRITHERYFKPESNSYVDGGQPYLAFALLSRVTPDALRPAVLERLAHTITDTNHGHIDAGMHGSMFLLRCLNEERRDDLVFLMATQTTYPGWGYMLEQGATTLWERWDGKRSQIHSTLQAAGEWFPRGLGGIRPSESQPGFKQIVIDPRPVPGLAWAKARYDSIRGPIVSEWRRDGARLVFDIGIPANATGILRIPAHDPESITEGDHPATSAAGVRFVRLESGLAEFELQSGRYRFRTEP